LLHINCSPPFYRIVFSVHFSHPRATSIQDREIQASTYQLNILKLQRNRKRTRCNARNIAS